MTRVGRILKGLCALGLLAGIAAGIPWALWHFIGWPLPHHVPSLAQLGHALDQRGIPDQALIDALAAAVWVTWAVLVASIAVEVPAALAGRRAPRLPLAGIFQPVTGRLVAAVIVAALSFAPRTTQVTALGSLGGGLSTAGGRQPVATLVLTGATQPLLATSKPATTDLSTPDAATASTNSSRTYVVQRGDTLWGIAERQLGDPLDWSEIYQLNEGRPQPDGRALTDPHWIYPGWTLVLPPAAHGPAGGHGAGDTSVPARHKSVPTSTTSPTRGNGTGGAGSGTRVGPSECAGVALDDIDRGAPQDAVQFRSRANLRVEEVRGCRTCGPSQDSSRARTDRAHRLRFARRRFARRPCAPSARPATPPPLRPADPPPDRRPRTGGTGARRQPRPRCTVVRRSRPSAAHRAPARHGPSGADPRCGSPTRDPRVHARRGGRRARAVHERRA